MVLDVRDLIKQPSSEELRTYMGMLNRRLLRWQQDFFIVYTKNHIHIHRVRSSVAFLRLLAIASPSRYRKVPRFFTIRT